MPKNVPTPVAAALGLIPLTLSGVRTLPGKVVQLPILAVSNVLTTLDAGRRGYDDLAERGERLVARLRGTSFDELEDKVEDALQGTPVANVYDKVEDAAEDAVEGAGRALRAVGNRATKAAGDAGQAVTGGARTATENAREAVSESRPGGDVPDVTPAEEAPKGVPTPKASEPDTTRVDTAATADVVETVEAVAASVSTPSGGTVLEHDDLPLADYDHMTLGSLRGRLRSLTVEQLVQVRDYEKAHADRLPVVTMLDNRIAKLATDPSATPSAGGTDAPVPELLPSQVAQGGSKVQPATGGPAQNPPSQGDPTNPAQPR